MKKICSAVLTAVMLTQGFGAVSFADTTDQTGTADPPEVLYQQTFSDWGAVNVPTNNGVGMVGGNANPSNTTQNYYTSFKQYEEEDGNKSALFWRGGNNNVTGIWGESDRNGAFDIIPFNKVITDGKIYVSMDFYAPSYAWDQSANAYSTATELDGAYAISLFNNSATDYTVNSAKDNTSVTYVGTGNDTTKFIAADSENDHSAVANYQTNHQSMLVGFNTSKDSTRTPTGSFMRMGDNGPTATENGGQWNWNSNVANNQWHKLQIIIDCDNEVESTDKEWKGNPVSVYIDGVKQSDNCSTAKYVKDTTVTGYKGIGFYRRNWVNGGMRFDNMYVSHYKNTADVKMLEEESDISDKKISVAFTDNLTKTPEASDFTVTNEKGGAVKGYSVSGNNNKVTFDFSNATGVPKNGKMTIAAKDTLKGLITNANVSGQVEIKVLGTEVLYEQTFSDWGDVNVPTDNGVGMVGGNANPSDTTKNYYTSFKQYEEEDGNRSALFYMMDYNGDKTAVGYEYTRNGAIDVIPFNKVINSGKIYVSMDFYTPKKAWDASANDGAGAYSDSRDLGGAYALTLFNNSTTDYTVNSEKDEQSVTYKAKSDGASSFIAADSENNHSAAADYQPNHQSMLVSLNTSGTKTDIATGKFLRMGNNTVANTDGAWNWNTIYEIEKWHKLEVVIDCDSNSEITSSDGKWKGNPVEVYIDGQKMGNDCSTARYVDDITATGWRGLGFYRRSWATGGIRFDNMYVSHYETEKQDSVKLLEDEKDFSDKKVSVAFTEYLNKAPEASDFDVKTNVGTPIEGYTVSGDARKATFDFTNATKLPIDGKVIITPKNTLTGKISGLNVSGSMEIPFGFSGTNVFEKQDEDGTWFTATTMAADDKVRAHINVTNGYSDTKNMVYIIAKYTKDDDGSLILSEIIKSESVPCEANGSKELMTEIINPDSSAVYKAFVWNADGYRPFMESAVIQ